MQLDFYSCAFIKDRIIILSYINDCLIFTQRKELIKEFIKNLNKDFDFNIKGSISSYLDIKITKNESRIELK